MDGAQSLIRNGLAQSDLDMNHFRLLNLDTSNLPPIGIPPTVVPPPSNWLNGWDATAHQWSYAQPGFTDLSGNLTRTQQLAIANLGTVLTGSWKASPITPAYLPTLDQINEAVSDVSIGGNRIINLANPINDSDAVNKGFMDLLLQGLNPKQACDLATTTNIALSGLPVIDGVQVTSTMRVLVKNQTDPTQNGVYAPNSRTWFRVTDPGGSGSQFISAYMTVTQGALNAGSSWVQVTPAPITIGTTPLLFILFSQATVLLAGNGLSRVGNILNVIGTPNRIAVGSAVDISSAYAGQTSITTLGTVTVGTWAANLIAPMQGGTGYANPFGISVACPFFVSLIGTPPSSSLTFKVGLPSSVNVPQSGTLATIDQPETFTNKRITKRFNKIASSAQPNIATDTTDAQYITAQATDITSMSANLTGTPTDSQELLIWIKDNGLPRNITWGASFRGSPSVALPVLTVAGFWLFTRFVYSVELAQWVITVAIPHI